MTGHNLILIIMVFQAAVAMALQPTIVSGTGVSSNVTGNVTGNVTSATTQVNETATIPPVAPPGRGLQNENDNITIIDTFNQPGIATVPVESPPDNVLATQIQNELIRQIPSYTASGRQVNSQNGNVVIQGSIQTSADRQRVTDIVKRMPGVKSVRNNLSVEEAGNTR